jgi:hypothetical protein
VSHQKRRRWAEQVLAEIRGLRADLARDRRERALEDPDPQAHRVWAAVFGATFAQEVRAAQPGGLDDVAIDRAIEEAAGCADWCAERRKAGTT